MKQLARELIDNGHAAGVGVHFAIESVETVFHDFAIFDVLARNHGHQHLLLLRDPLLDTVGLREEFVEGESVEKSLLAKLSEFLKLAVAVVNGGETFLNGRSVAFTELFALKIGV